MNNKSLKVLRIVALVIGWLLAVFLILDIVGILVAETMFMGSAAPQFNIGKFLNHFFSRFGNIFLAFLIAAVVGMIEKQAPVGKEIASRLMIVCCLSYVTAALGQIYEAILALILISYWPKWYHLGAYPSPIQLLIPILFAVSIFVFYTHFTKMVTFESEVA